MALLKTAYGVEPERSFGKPNPAMLSGLLKKYKPEEILFVGDRLYTDFELAKRSGCRFVLPLCGETKQQDLDKLYDYLTRHGVAPEKASLTDLQDFIYHTFGTATNSRTQSRVLSGIRSFYRFLLYNHLRDDDPSELIESPRKERHLPEVLTLDEVNRLVSAIDLSSPEGHRNRAIIEMLYGSGLRVSELTALRLSNMYRDEGYMLIQGKGSKQRLVPISPEA